jgi:hypothetical protein
MLCAMCNLGVCCTDTVDRMKNSFDGIFLIFYSSTLVSTIISLFLEKYLFVVIVYLL